MKLTLLHLLLVTTCSPLVIVAVQPTAECIRLAQSANCSFYTECVERNMPCGPSGYVVGYGYHFCNAFVADHHRVCVCVCAYVCVCACVRVCVHVYAPVCVSFPCHYHSCFASADRHFVSASSRYFVCYCYSLVYAPKICTCSVYNHIDFIPFPDRQCHALSNKLHLIYC